MKILYVANVRMPGDRANALQLGSMAKALRAAGADLELVVPAIASNKKGRLMEGHFEGLPVRRLPVVYFLPKTRFGFNARAGSFAVASFVYCVWRRFCGERFVIYTIDLDQFSFFLLPLVAPTFIEVHGSKNKNSLSEFFFRRIRGVIAVSGYVAEKLRETFVLRAPVIVERNGIDLTLFRPVLQAEARRTLAVPSGPIALYNGRAYAWKGLDTLVKAAKRVPEMQIYMVGMTDEELVGVGETLPENIVCVGLVASSHMPLWLSIADVFILTGTAKDQYSFYETSPMKLFEYMAIGKPIVAANTPAIAEVVSQNDVVFYEPDNVESFVAALHRALSQAPNQKASENIARYSWQSRATEVLEFVKAKRV